MSASEKPPEFVVVPGATVGNNQRAVPVRLLFVQGEERPAVDASDEPMVMTVPHLLVRELIAFLSLSIVLIVLALLFNAPLSEMADPTRTPNPAKAPWYFLGLQELLHYYPPLVSGVLRPSLLIVALAVIPYVRINLERAPLTSRLHARRAAGSLMATVAVLTVILYYTGSQPVWPLIGPLWVVASVMLLGLASSSKANLLRKVRSRSLPFWIFLWFLLTATTLTIIGVFFRGPGWRFTLPWRDGMFY